MNADLNVVVAVLALRAGIVSPDQFAQALTAWCLDRALLLDEWLVAQGWCTPAEAADLRDGAERALADGIGLPDGAATAAEDSVPPEDTPSASFASFDPEATALAPNTSPLTEPYVSLAEPSLVQLSSSDFALGASAERYQLGVLHAVGGLGQVWRARDARIGREVALKEIRPEQSRNPAVGTRFLREAQITGQLEHPGIVPIYELGRRKGTKQPFYTMRFLRGRTMQEELRAFHRLPPGSPVRRLKLRELLGAFVSVCQAVAYAHARGVLHRDLKPQNVMMGDFGEAVVVDWGLAKVLGVADDDWLPVEDVRANGDSGATMMGQVLGTPAYMPPEQARGDAAGPGADVYGLGAILYEALTGAAPYSGATAAEVLGKVKASPPPRPRSVAADAPRGLDAVCMKAMAPRPEDRYASAAELARDVRHWLADEPLAAAPDSWPQRFARFVRRRKSAALAAATALALVSVVSVAAAVAVNEERKRSATLAEERKELADSNRRLAVREAGARAEAVTRAEAERAARAAAQRQTVEVILSRGQALCEQRKVALGLLWFARGLELAPADAPELTRVLCGNLAGWRRELAPLRHVLQHSQGVIDAVFSPDGRKLATASLDGTARVWDAASGRPLTPPLAHGGELRAVRFSPDGTRVATASDNRTARLWDAVAGAAIGAPLAHRHVVNGLEFDPTGALLATAGEDDCARLWDARTGAALGKPLEHGAHVWGLAFSADGRRVATASADRTARVWDTATGQPVGPAFRHEHWLYRVALNRAGTLLATGSADRTARLWRLSDGQPASPPLRHDGAVRVVAFSPDGKLLATGGDDNVARLWDTATANPVGSPLRHAGAVRELAFSPDGGTLLTGSADGTAGIWDTRTSLPKGPSIEHQSRVTSVAFSPDGRTLATASADRTCRVWDFAAAAPRAAVLPHGDVVEAVAAHGDLVATAAQDMRVRLWRADGTPAGRPLDALCYPFGVAFHPTGKWVAAGGTDAWVRAWDAQSFTTIPFEVVHAGPVDCVAFSPDGQAVASGAWDNNVHVWDWATKKRRLPPLAHRNRVGCVAFSPDGRWLASGSMDGTAKVWNAATGQLAWPELPHGDTVTGVAFLPGGRRLATGCQDRVVRLWDMATGQQEPRTFVHQGAVRGLAFSADGRTLAAAVDDKTARLWDVETGYPLGAPFVHDGAVKAVTFVGAARLATASSDKTARIWRLEPAVAPEPARLRAWVETLAGMTLDAGGGARILDAAEWQRRRADLQALGGPPGSD